MDIFLVIRCLGEFFTVVAKEAMQAENKDACADNGSETGQSKKSKLCVARSQGLQKKVLESVSVVQGKGD